MSSSHTSRSASDLVDRALLGAAFAAGFSNSMVPILSGFPEDAAAAASQSIANAMAIVFEAGDTIHRSLAFQAVS